MDCEANMAGTPCEAETCNLSTRSFSAWHRMIVNHPDPDSELMEVPPVGGKEVEVPCELAAKLSVATVVELPLLAAMGRGGNYLERHR